MRAVQLAPFLQHLHHQRGGGERQAEPRDDGGGQAAPRDEQRIQGDERARDEDLRRAQTEDVAPQLPKARQLQFEADDEQEQHDAQFGHSRELAGAAEQAEGGGADGDPGREVAQHRTEPEPLGERHGDDGRGQ